MYLNVNFITSVFADVRLYGNKPKQLVEKYIYVNYCQRYSNVNVAVYKRIV